MSDNLILINARINKEINRDMIDKLTDKQLMSEFIKTPSVIKEKQKLTEILTKYINDENIIKNIIEEYLPSLVPAGTKGVIRGLMFNIIIKKHILNMNLDIATYEVKFETRHNMFPTAEIPDWYILNKTTNKIMIGMNQLDLWNGGHQINRASNYILNSPYNTSNSKLVCVVCNDITIKNTNCKIYNIFKAGFENDTLCYINNLSPIILNYFNINT